jgi:hypothetical protein
MGKIVENSGFVVIRYEYCEIFKLNENERGMVFGLDRFQGYQPISL